MGVFSCQIPAKLSSLICGRTFQISHARRAGKPSFLNNKAMLSGDIIGDSGAIKGVAAVAAGSALFFLVIGSTPFETEENQETDPD